MIVNDCCGSPYTVVLGSDYKKHVLQKAMAELFGVNVPAITKGYPHHAPVPAKVLAFLYSIRIHWDSYCYQILKFV